MKSTQTNQSLSILLKSMFERKIFVIVTTALFVIIELLIMLPRHRLYQSEATFVIGTYMNLKNQLTYLENVEQLSSRLLNRYPALSKVEYKGHGYVVVRATDDTASETQAKLDEILKEVLSYHNDRLKQIRELYEKRLDYFLDQRKLINANISNYSLPLKKKENISEERNALAYFLYLEQVKNGGNRLDQIEDMIFQYKQALLLDFQPTRIIKKPTLPLKPNRPKILKYTVLSFVLGLVVSLFGAFCLAYRDYTLSLFKNSESDHSN